jgi:acetoacetyl-CoA synthetase
MAAFLARVSAKRGLGLAGYDDLYRWSVEKPAEFWADAWEFLGMRSEGAVESVLDDAPPKGMPHARWFKGVRVSHALNLLRWRDGNEALVFRGEDGRRVAVSYAELTRRVAALAAAFVRDGVKAGDRVAAVMPNTPEAVIAMLAATAIGAVWSSCSPDFGARGVLDRFGQIEPKALVATRGYFFKGKWIDTREKLREIAGALPSLARVVVFDFPGGDGAAPGDDRKIDPRALAHAAHVDDGSERTHLPIPFAMLPFDHPVYVMYSSGTTGLPKGIVQGPGVLLNHLKELVLHCDLRREDRIFYFTTTSWMMWNWLVSSLAVGATVVLFDGNPFHPGPEALWRLAGEERLTVFGTSAKYLAALEASGYRPDAEQQAALAPLRLVLSTGSPLMPESFDFVYTHLKRDVQLASISGGTDLNGCFALGNPLLPVRRGELQSRGLGMAVEVWDETGRPVVGRRGELVCTRAFPSMPLGFWNDPTGVKYLASYFGKFSLAEKDGSRTPVWCHGDFVELTPSGGLVFEGRSDATLNPGGVRIGSAEIYRVVERIPEIEDSVVIGQKWEGDERVVLFVKLRPGRELDEALRQRIVAAIRSELTPRHVPAKIVAAPAIPYTMNMKKVEIAVRRTVEGQSVPNTEALANPECLAFFKDVRELLT